MTATANTISAGSGPVNITLQSGTATLTVEPPASPDLPEDQPAPDTPTVDVVDPEPADDPIAKEVREEDGAFCVYSKTGRRFGCYPTEELAVDRLRQIESFRDKQLAGQPTRKLAALHDGFHALSNVTNDHIVAHNLVEDELESQGVAPPYRLGDIDDKLALIDGGMAGPLPVAKEDEFRYTLGPMYVPSIEDAHGEFTDARTLQRALWDWVRKDDRRIHLQHSDKVAGEMVECLTWPFSIDVDLEVPNQGVTKKAFPADTPFLGVVWEPWAWELVKAGELRGYSIGGRARRVEAELPVPDPA